MYNGDVGNIGAGQNSNVAWNKQLAAELDAADGKKDGKISASVWNGFINKTGSNGNKIKNFINLNNAEKSFNYYDKKKDVGKVDWKNWNSMLNDFKEESVGRKAEETPQPTPAPKQDVKAEDTPEPTPAPKQDVQADETPKPTPAPKQDVQADETPKPIPAPKQDVKADETPKPTPAPKQDVKADETPKPAPAPKQDAKADEAKPANPSKSATPAKKEGDINGKFDEKIKQGDTGDCYDIAAVSSILAKKGGKAFLEGKIKVDQSTGIATVNYAGREIKINIREAQNSHHLDRRGGDMRLYELAENDDRLYNRSTKRDANGTTLDGGFTADIYKKMGLKDVRQEIIPEGQRYDFSKLNDPNRAFQYQSATYTDMRDGSLISAGVPVAHKANGQTAKLQEEHAYTVLGYKDGMILLHDPNLTFDPNNPIGPNTLYVPASEMSKYAFAMASGSIA